jgi:hypothetical protein
VPLPAEPGRPPPGGGRREAGRSVFHEVPRARTGGPRGALAAQRGGDGPRQLPGGRAGASPNRPGGVRVGRRPGPFSGTWRAPPA